MSIKTTGQVRAAEVRADTFKQETVGPVTAGFVKNDSSGNFIFGQSGGGAGGAWELIEVKDITTAATSVTFTGLDGDTDGEYLLLYRLRKILATGSNARYTIRPNGISANQTSILRVHSTTGNNGTFTFSDLRIAGGGLTAGVQQIGVLNFDAKTGTEARQFISDVAVFADLITVTVGGLRRDNYAGVWEDTVTNITSLDVVANFTNGIGVGSQLCLYRKKS